MYSDADIIALDDPLSAVDAHVAERLFSDAICGLRARGKTVILVTHALHFLEQVDHVYYLGEGKIQEQGSFPSLMAAGGLFADLVRDFGSGQASKKSNEDGDEEELEERPRSEANEKVKDRGVAEGTGKIEGILIKKEARKTGNISGAGERSECHVLMVATYTLFSLQKLYALWWWSSCCHSYYRICRPNARLVIRLPSCCIFHRQRLVQFLR